MKQEIRRSLVYNKMESGMKNEGVSQSQYQVKREQDEIENSQKKVDNTNIQLIQAMIEKIQSGKNDEAKKIAIMSLKSKNQGQTKIIEEDSVSQLSIKKSTPTAVQLCQALVLLQNKLPNRSIEEIIKVMNSAYENKKKAAALQAPSMKINKTPYHIATHFSKSVQQQSNPQVDQNEQNSKYAAMAANVHIFPIQKTLRTFFSNDADKKQYTERRLVAKAHVFRGYGIAESQAEFDANNICIQLTKNKFHCTLRGVVTFTYRKLQSFLANECKRHIKFLDYEQVRSLWSAALMNIRIKVPQPQANTFLKFMQAAYGLAEVSISELEAVQCYIQILKYARGQNITMQELQLQALNEKNRLIQNRMDGQFITDTPNQNAKKPEKNANKQVLSLIEWTQKMDQYLAALYIEHHNIDIVVNAFFPPQPATQITTRLARIIKRSLKCIQLESQTKYGNQPTMKHLILGRLEADQLRVILKGKDWSVRTKMLDFWRSAGKGKVKLDDIVQIIKKVCAISEKQTSAPVSVPDKSKEKKKINQVEIEEKKGHQEQEDMCFLEEQDMQQLMMTLEEENSIQKQDTENE